MMIDKTQISGKRFMFTVAYFIQSSILLTSFTLSLTRQDSWLTVIFSFTLFLPMIWVYRTIMVQFPDKNLIQVLETVFGKFVGKLIGIGFTWFFLNLTTLNLRDLGVFTIITVMTDTPLIVLAIMCMFVAVYSVRKGINVVCRYSAAFTTLQITIIIISIFLVFDQAKFNNFLPIFDQPQLNYLQGVHVMSTIPFGELVVLLMLTPNIRMDKKLVAKYWYIGFAIGGVSFLLVMLREISVLGNLAHLFSLPSLTTFRLIHVGTIFNRIEILFAMALILLLTFKVVFLTYVTVLTIAQIMELENFENLCAVIGLLIVPLVITIYPNSIENQTSGQQVVPFIWMIFEIVLPIFILIVAAVKNLPKQKPKTTPIKQPQKNENN